VKQLDDWKTMAVGCVGWLLTMKLNSGMMTGQCWLSWLKNKLTTANVVNAGNNQCLLNKLAAHDELEQQWWLANKDYVGWISWLLTMNLNSRMLSGQRCKCWLNKAGWLFRMSWTAGWWQANDVNVGWRRSWPRRPGRYENGWPTLKVLAEQAEWNALTRRVDGSETCGDNINFLGDKSTPKWFTKAPAPRTKMFGS
jgi:hypothetical protein